MQVSVREVVPRRMKEILAQIESSASSDMISPDGSADGTLSAQLEIAVNTLSQGLVERDTEVRHTALSMLLHAPTPLHATCNHGALNHCTTCNYMP